MANSGELLINAVISSKPKALTGLNQKGKRPGAGAPHSPAVAVEPSVERQSLRDCFKNQAKCLFSRGFRGRDPFLKQFLNHPWYIRGTW